MCFPVTIGGESASFTHLPPRLGEARDTQADITKIKTMMDWEPQVKLEDWLLKYGENLC